MSERTRVDGRIDQAHTVTLTLKRFGEPVIDQGRLANVSLTRVTSIVTTAGQTGTKGHPNKAEARFSSSHLRYSCCVVDI